MLFLLTSPGDVQSLHVTPNYARGMNDQRRNLFQIPYKYTATKIARKIASTSKNAYIKYSAAPPRLNCQRYTKCMQIPSKHSNSAADDSWHISRCRITRLSPVKLLPPHLRREPRWKLRAVFLRYLVPANSATCASKLPKYDAKLCEYGYRTFWLKKERERERKKRRKKNDSKRIAFSAIINRWNICILISISTRSSTLSVIT